MIHIIIIITLLYYAINFIFYLLCFTNFTLRFTVLIYKIIEYISKGILYITDKIINSFIKDKEILDNQESMTTKLMRQINLEQDLELHSNESILSSNATIKAKRYSSDSSLELDIPIKPTTKDISIIDLV